MELAIAVFVVLSYVAGSKAIFSNTYQPSLYSRIIWLLLAANNLASVIALQNNASVLVLAGLGFIGNAVIFTLTLKKSKRVFGKTEIIASILLLTSLIVWIVTRLPILNLTIGLIAHFIGGIPTYKKVIKNPHDEDTLFWFFFFIASLLAFIITDKSSIANYLYPFYFMLFDGAITILCLRRYFKN